MEPAADNPLTRGPYARVFKLKPVTHFLLLSLWESIEAVQAFAGTEYEVAHYCAEDDDYLLEREPFVTHYEVLAGSGALMV